MYPPAQSPTRAQQLIADYGRKCRPPLVYDTTRDRVDILTVDRTDINWIPAVRRSAVKPDRCPSCSHTGVYQLDHMNPWRPYVIFMLGYSEFTQTPDHKLMVSKDIVRALYNDPENLWWICTHCNQVKSDQIYTIDNALALKNGAAPGTPEVTGTPIRDTRTLLTLLP